MIYFIDVSKFQLKINWTKVAAAVDAPEFAFIRSNFGCEGPNKLDPRFDENWKGCADAGLIRGPYQFLVATQSGKAQAEYFLETLAKSGGLLEGDLSPVVDIEEPRGATPSTILKCLADWCEVIERETKRHPIVYTGPGFWDGYKLGNDFRALPLWVADYRYEPQVPGGWEHWTFWQFSDKQRIDGIRGNVDGNLFFGTLEELAQHRTVRGETALKYSVVPRAIRWAKRSLKTMPKIKM